jgi:hypothetical protein
MRATLVICAGLVLVVTAPQGASTQPVRSPPMTDPRIPTIPRLVREDDTARLVVDGQPFLVLGGELGNSSASTLASAKPLLAKLGAMNLNTVLVPVSWELVEPVEGKFSFGLVGDLLAEARRHKLRVVLLWFGSWKNGMSSYVPTWVKSDQKRFPRAEVKAGHGIESLSAFADSNRDADSRAFAALMRYVRKVDGREHTVIMVQVENEVAMIGEAADRSAAAARAFREGPPAELVSQLTAHRASLEPWLLAAWKKQNFVASGGWQDMFGAGPDTEQLFMAWHYARYVDAVARAGKAEYALPMFVNAALNRPGLAPGQYPSGGPLARLFDVWKPGAPSIDFIAPDIYLPSFVAWCEDFARRGNPLFIPEAKNDLDAATNVFFAIGEGAFGFSPFSIESSQPAVASALGKAYAVLGQLAPAIYTARQNGKDKGNGTGKAPGTEFTAGVLLTKEQPKRTLALGDYLLSVVHDYTWEWSSSARHEAVWPHAAGLAIALAPDELVVAGDGLIVTFAPKPANRSGTAAGDPITLAGIERIDEGRYENGTFVVVRRLNGDETHQGRHLRLPLGSPGIQRVKLYRYH